MQNAQVPLRGGEEKGKTWLLRRVNNILSPDVLRGTVLSLWYSMDTSYNEFNSKV